MAIFDGSRHTCQFLMLHMTVADVDEGLSPYTSCNHHAFVFYAPTKLIEMNEKIQIVPIVEM